MGTAAREAQAEQREELLDAAWAVAARDGLGACTYRNAAAEAGTSTTPFVQRFPTRQDLLKALFSKLSAAFDEAREAEKLPSGPLEAIVAEGAGVLADDQASAARRRISLDLAFEGLRDGAIGRGVRERERDREGRWRALVDEGRARGKIRDDRPAEEVVDQLGSLLDGLALATLIYPRRLPPAHVRGLWEHGARRLADPRISLGVYQRLIVAEGPPARSLLLGDPEVTRRQELLAVAFRVTAREGLAGLSFRALAEEAGTSTTPFTYAFGSREQLLAEMVRATWAGVFGIRELASRIVSPVDRFFAEWAAELSDDSEQVDRERVYYELHHEALSDEALAALVREGDQQGFMESLELVEDGREQGLVREDLPAGHLVDTLYAMVDGIALRRALLSEKRPAGYRVALWEDAGRRILAP
ncbi:MAG: TetR/AcrR family transcriptional regulator [Solirubrobacterales bacterium]